MQRTAFYIVFLTLLGVCSMPAHAQQPQVPYCAETNWMPYEGVRNGKHIGLVADYLRLVSELTGIQFSVVKTEDWKQSLTYLAAGKCHVAVMSKSAQARSRSIRFSHVFMDMPDVLITRANMPMLQGYAGIGDRRLAVVRDYRHADYLARYYPAVTVVPVASEYEGFRALREHEVDVMVGSLLSVNAYLNKHGDDDFVLSGIAEPYDGLRFALGSTADPAMVGLLNRGISAIPQSRTVDIYKRWNQVSVRQGQTWWPILGGLIAVMVVAGLIAWRQRTLRQFKQLLHNRNADLEALQAVVLEKNRTIEFLSNHDAVTGLFNRNHFILKGEEEISRYTRFQSPASLVVMDLLAITAQSPEAKNRTQEYFLRCIGKACLSSVREVDVIARWSNDQLVFLCPQTSQSDATTLANRLLQCIELAARHQGFTVTIAAGVAALNDNWSFNDWYEQACSVLYQARRQGGGVVSLTSY